MMLLGERFSPGQRFHLRSMFLYASIIQCAILIPCIVVFRSIFSTQEDAFIFVSAAQTNYSDPAAASSQIQMNDTESIIASPIDDEEPSVAQQLEPKEHAGLLLRSFFDDILELQTVYGSDLVTIHDAPTKYPVLNKSSFPCPFTYNKATTTNCFTPIITIYDRISNSLDELHEPSIPLPEVLLLSALDYPQQMDLFGPSSVYTTLKLLLECAHCESLSPWVVTNDTSKAIECRTHLQSQGINDSIRKWLARLVVTRRIVAVPIINVAGFYYSLVDELSRSHAPDWARFDNGVACDFPHPQYWWSPGESEAPTCFTTYPARILNEMFHSHVFQIGVSFHGYQHTGTDGWIRIPDWKPTEARISFDKQAMVEISNAMGSFGKGLASPFYMTGTSTHNECIGSTFQNWAFTTASLEASIKMGGPVWLQECSCGDGGCDYPSERRNFNDGAPLRSFIARVVAPPRAEKHDLCFSGYDTTNMRDCEQSSYRDSLFTSAPLGINIRMSLAAIDLVQPYTYIKAIAGVELHDDIVPKNPRFADACIHNKAMILPESPSMKNVTVTWTVGGAISVDETTVMYGEWSVLDKKIFNCVTRPTKQELDAFFSILRDVEVMEGETEEQMETDVTFAPVQGGITRWHPKHIEGDTAVRPETDFSISLDLSRYKKGDVIAIFTLARVDQKWVRGYFEESQSENSGPPPQSNIVNARTNPEWKILQPEIDSTEREPSIKGQLDFFSVPVTIEIGSRPGFFEGSEIIDASIRLEDSAFVKEESSETGVVIYALVMAIVTIISVFFCIFCREKSDGTDIFSVLSARRQIMHQRISVEDFFREEGEITDLELTPNTIT